MMATEATTENAGTPSILYDNELNKTETPIQDVPAEGSTVNGNSEGDGIKKESEQELVDGITNSAEASVSGGSDTEASKTAKAQADEKGHGRTTSTVKKYASFKPVSVNKTFLASKGATAATPSKLGDKGNAGTTTAPIGPTATLTARPRLVAKTGSGLGTSTPRSSAAANGGKPGAAPDGSAVWNKNRPAPPPEQKRFTDEELKQRYGIHMATRLESDKEGKQANWADIDDDDDDWAPETIEWTDGTKVALPQQADEVVPREPTPEPEPIPAVKEIKPLEATKPQSPAPAQPTPSPTIKTGGFGNGRAGLVLKGAAEKPTLVAKPPGPPTPVKSPWAPLPPVDKVAPVSIEIPQNQQQQQSRFGQRDPHGFQNMPPPAKEIAADDFSRSWRENGPSTNRELYNSQSGRYEPVNDNRRGNTRSDPHARQPAVLQRPTQQEHPEPSAAFQTHRSGQDTSYGRRRTSSNVSGGSGLLRRMSRGHDLPPPHELLNARRGSLAAVSDAPSSPRNFSPSGQHQNQRGYRASPVTSHPSPHPVAGQTVPPISDGVHMSVQPIPGFPTQEDVEEQKRLMREKREAAIQRRKDEEAKEEAARKERIRLKLEAMGPAPESKSRQKDAPKDEKLSVPTQIQTRDSASALPTPESLKVKASEAEVTTIPDSLEHEKIESPPQSLKSRVNGDHPAAPSTSTTQDGRGPQSWQNAPPSSTERYNSWASAHPPQQRSVWGPPPSNDKTLGNGTFNPELSRMPEMHQGSSNPGPIAPPTANRVNGNGHYPPSRGRDQYESRPGPIAPPNRQQGFPRPEPQNRAQQVAAWNSLPEKLAQEDALLVQQQAEELGRRRALQEAGLAPEISQPVFKDTWRQVHLNEDGSRTAVQANITTMHNEPPVTSPTWNQSEQSGNRHEVLHPQFNETWRRSGVDNSTINSGSLPGMNASPPVRNSRFFPNRDVRLEDNVSFERPGSPSPPPPTMAGHPAYDGDAAHPHVSFPRPPPVVKLPPVLAPIGPPKPTKPATFAAAIAAPAPPPAIPIRQGAPARGNVSQEAVRPSAGGWQDKINSLIGRKTPPKSHALAVDSSSKNALELPNSQFAATVSFPTTASGSAIDGTVATKPAAEECFEEQEMGSLPVVRVPHKAPELAWNIAPPPKSIPKKFLVSHITTVGDLNFSLGNTITIMLPGQTEGKSVYAPTILSQRQKSNPRRRGGASRSSSSVHPRGGRARDSQSGFPSPSPDHASTSSTPTSGRGSGGYRGRGGHSGGNPWTNPRHVSTPVHT